MATLIGNDHKPDTLIGTDGDDLLDGRGGNDTLEGLGGNDTLLGGDGNDQLSGGSGTNYLDGGPGNDTYYFTGGADTIVDGDGDNTLSFANAAGPVGPLDDTGFIFDGVFYSLGSGIGNIIGSPYDDQLFLGGSHGGDGNDFLGADAPESYVYGDAGNDFLTGGQNGDVFMYGGEGNDTLRATLSCDLTGGKGSDTFQINYQYEADLTGFSSDGSIINDFKHGKDLIELSGRDPEAYLTNDGDLWTVHSPHDTVYQEAVGDPNAEYTISFEIHGVTHLEEGVDYTFDTSADSVLV
jgi:Ca2+-binding RTX toxin-like protein